MNEKTVHDLEKQIAELKRQVEEQNKDFLFHVHDGENQKTSFPVHADNVEPGDSFTTEPQKPEPEDCGDIVDEIKKLSNRLDGLGRSVELLTEYNALKIDGEQHMETHGEMEDRIFKLRADVEKLFKIQSTFWNDPYAQAMSEDIANLKQQVKNIASQLRFTDHIHEPQKPEKHWTDQVKENQKPEWKPTGHCADVDPPDSTTERAKCGGRCTNECIQS